MIRDQVHRHRRNRRNQRNQVTFEAVFESLAGAAAASAAAAGLGKLMSALNLRKQQWPLFLHLPTQSEANQ